MTYAITWKGCASRDVATLPLGAASALVEFTHGPLADDPYRVGEPLGVGARVTGGKLLRFGLLGHDFPPVAGSRPGGYVEPLRT